MSLMMGAASLESSEVETKLCLHLTTFLLSSVFLFIIELRFPENKSIKNVKVWEHCTFSGIKNPIGSLLQGEIKGLHIVNKCCISFCTTGSWFVISISYHPWLTHFYYERAFAKEKIQLETQMIRYLFLPDIQ